MIRRAGEGIRASFASEEGLVFSVAVVVGPAKNDLTAFMKHMLLFLDPVFAFPSFEGRIGAPPSTIEGISATLLVKDHGA